MNIMQQNIEKCLGIHVREGGEMKRKYQPEGIPELKSAAREEYEEIYCIEIQRNRNFRCFISNLKFAYEGENTRKAQMNSRKVTKGSTFGHERGP